MTRKPGPGAWYLGVGAVHSSAVFHTAAVWFSLRYGNLFSRPQFLDRFTHVIARGARIAFRDGAVINRALVSEGAALVYDKHVRRRSHSVFLSNFAGVVIEPGGGLDLLLRPFFLCGGGITVAGV